MKKNTNGFMLVEFLVVSIFVLGVLIFLTVQFNNINKSYNRSFKYDTVPDLYFAKNIKNMILNDGYDNLKDEVELNSFADFTECSTSYFITRNYCRALLEHENVKTALFVSQDLVSFKATSFYSELNEGFKTYIKTLKNSNNGSYMILLEFNDDTYSSLKF